MTATETVAAVVKFELGKRGLSQADLARQLDVSEAAISLKLGASRPWSLKELDKLSGFLGVPLPVLLMAPVGAQGAPPTLAWGARWAHPTDTYGARVTRGLVALSAAA